MTTDEPAVEFVDCPECGELASIEWQADFCGVTHCKVRCIQRHWFLMPAECLETQLPQGADDTTASVDLGDRPGDPQ